MSSFRRRKFVPLGDLLDGILEQALPEDRGLRAQLVAEAFLRLAGPVVAGRCRILALEGDTLRVAVSIPRWHKELQQLSGDYLRRVNDELPPSLRLAAIRFLGPQKKREP